MKYVLTSILALLVTVSFSFAETDDTSVESERPARSSRGKQARKYSKTLTSLVNKAGRLKIDENQEAELLKIKDEYVVVIIKQENEFIRAHAAIMRSLSKADFDMSKVKKEVKKDQALEQQIIYRYIDGLNALRKTIGSENYNNLFPAARNKKEEFELRKKREKKRMEQGKEEAQE